ncbi:MAG: PAS domain S-box protein [Sideroxydans sp.]|nr:PAS domain S-box protein [Sideroxydans sp.]
MLKDRLARLAPAVQRALSVEQGVRARKAAEIALRESLTRYTAVTESANDAIISMRPDGTIDLWNKMAQQMFGYSAEEAIGKQLHQLIASESCRRNADQGLRLFEQTGSGPVVGHTIESTALRRDGSEFPVELSISAMNLGGAWHATGIIRDITERKQVEEERRINAEKQAQALAQTIDAVAAMVEARDPYTAGHQRRVADLSCAIAGEMGFSADQIHGLRLAATIHDLGKIHIPAEILSKPGRLSPIEFELIKAHPQAGYDIIKDVQFPWPIAQMVLQHHERLDGSGYPQGLKDEQILPEAKILAVADVVEAMVSHRPYRPGLGVDAALEEITHKRGVLYDPAVVDCCVSLFEKNKFALDPKGV